MADQTIVAMKTEIVLTKMEGFSKRKLFVMAATCIVFILVVLSASYISFNNNKMKETRSKRDQPHAPSGLEEARSKRENSQLRDLKRSQRNWLSDLFGAEPDSPSLTETRPPTTSTAPTTTKTSATTTEDDIDRLIDELFGPPEPELPSSSTKSTRPTASNTSMSNTMSNSTTPTASNTPMSNTISNSTTSTASNTSMSNTISNSTTSTASNTSMSSTMPNSTPKTTKTSRTSAEKSSTSSSEFTTSTGSETTSKHTTLPFCAEPNFKLAEICVIPDQLKQQRNFNITYQDFVDAVRAEYLVNFWEGCLHDDPCTLDVDVINIETGLAERWINENNHAQLCPWMQCLEFINQTVEFCMKEKEYVLNVTKLMCSFDFHITTENRKCARDVVGMLNRNMGDNREANDTASMRRCHDDFSPCQTSCKKYYEDMANVYDVSCATFKGHMPDYYPWHWYVDNSKAIKDSCEMETGEGTNYHGFNYYNEILKDKGLVAGIVLSCAVAMTAMIILTTVFVKRMRRRKYYGRDGVEYSEVTGLMAADDRDEPEKHHF